MKEGRKSALKVAWSNDGRTRLISLTEGWVEEG